MGWPYPDGIKREITELPIILLLVWVPLGIVPSLFIPCLFFPPEKVGLLIPFIIYLIGIGLLFLFYLILEKIEFSSNKFLRWFCGFD
jgi:nitric oxide reductase large subunit